MLTSFNKYDKSYGTYTGKNNSLYRISQFEQHNMVLFLTITEYNQWRIQNFPYGDANPWVWDKTHYLERFWPKTAWKWKKKLDGGRGSRVPSALFGSANDIKY